MLKEPPLVEDQPKAKIRVIGAIFHHSCHKNPPLVEDQTAASILIRVPKNIIYMTLIYCYDAYCGWCYGFSPVIKQLAEAYQDQLEIEVLSGGMIMGEKPKPIAVMAGYIQEAYKVVEDHTGIQFGQDYLWHIFHPEESDWFPDSLKPAIALCIFKELYPERQVDFASDLQYALHYEGRDLCDDEAYRHLLEKYSIREELFYQRLHSPEYEEQARYEFALCQQLQVTGYPALLLQTGETQFYLVSRGYTAYGPLKERLDAILQEQAQKQ